MADTHTLTEADLTRLVDRFYDKVRRDDVLGPVFNPAVHDWDAHKGTLVDFWASVVLRAGRYRGNPMAMHRPHEIEAWHFDHWLALWKETAVEVTGPEDAQVLMAYAERIGRSLKYGLGLDSHRRPLGLPVAERRSF
jgi:hemoglobin